MHRRLATLLVSLSLGVSPVLAQTGIGNDLEELALRNGTKPLDLLSFDGIVFPSERTVFKDTVTGAEIWRLTHALTDELHLYYDIPVWNTDGSLLLHGSDIDQDNWFWVVAADTSWKAKLNDLVPAVELPEGQPGQADTYWSWLDANQLLELRGGIVYRLDLTTGLGQGLFNVSEATGGLTLDLKPPHPADDRLLFHNTETGRVFVLDPGTLEFLEVPNDGRWALTDGLHRLRWTKDHEPGVEPTIFIGQNRELVDGVGIDNSVQYLGDLDGNLTPCMPVASPNNRGGHPDISMDGRWWSGYYKDNQLWILDCQGSVPERKLYQTGSNQRQASHSWDNRWIISDNGLGAPGAFTIRGLDVSESLVLLSHDGRTQAVLAYPHATMDEYAEEWQGEPVPDPVTSPDGTKVAFDADTLDPFGPDKPYGNVDMWLTVLRKPFPPLAVAAESTGTEVEISWLRPRQADEPVYWNPGNESREIAGYHVYRGTESGGPYEQLTAVPTDATSFVDDRVEAGVEYYYVVQSIEHSGLASLYSDEAAANLDGSGWLGAVRRYYEAEAGVLTLPMVQQIDRVGASGGWYVGTFAQEPDPVFPLEPYPARVALTVDAPRTDSYALWARVRAYDGSDGSAFEVSVDGEVAGALTLPEDAWRWVALAAELELAAGEHIVELAAWEPSMAIDRVALLSDGSVPPDAGNSDVTPPTAPSGTVLQRIDGSTKKLVWNPSPEADVQYYNVYCGRDAGFALDNHHILLSPLDPEILDWGIPDGLGTVYKVTAVDRFGNESEPAVHDPSVDGEGSAPEALDDLYVVDEDSVLVAPESTGILANDRDGDGDDLSVLLMSTVEHGELDLDLETGAFTYTPDPEYWGPDGFTYRATDGFAETFEANVTIDVVSVNDPPVALADHYSTSEEVALIINQGSGLKSNDSDVEGDPLTVELVDPATHGVLVLDTDGSFNFNPTKDFFGTEAFSYRLWDGQDYSPTATVEITVSPVDDAPDGFTDTYVTLEDQPLVVAAPGVLVNDVEVDGDPLTATLSILPLNGTLDLLADGSFVYAAFADYAGNDSFHYLVSDGTSQEEIKVNLTVSPVNDPPVAVADAYTIVEDEHLSGVGEEGVLENDSDVDDGAGALTAVLASGVETGALTLDPTGNVIYIPVDDFNGTVTFTYQTSDGEALSAPATVTITVLPVNDAPVATADTYSLDEGGILTQPAPGVLGNDSDVDADPMTAILVTGVTAGSLLFPGDGSFEYTPSVDFSGADSFTYKISDGALESKTVKVTLNVTASNDVPVATNDSYTLDEDKTYGIGPGLGVLANDTDADGDDLTATLATDVSHGTITLGADGSFTYVPSANYHGTDSFTYTASDGVSVSPPATVTFTVTPINDTPMIVPEAYGAIEDTILNVAAPGVLGNDSDVDGDPLTAILDSTVLAGSLVLRADGSFDYTPNPDYTGADRFSYKVSDGTTTTAKVTVDLTVAAVNDAPVSVADAYSLNEDKTLNATKATGVLANDTDVESDVLTALLVTPPAHGSVALAADGSFTYTAVAHYNGADSFTYRANDGTADSATTTVSLTVTAVNDTPTAVADAYTAPKDGVLQVAAPGVLGNDVDVDGDTLVAVLDTLPGRGTLSLLPDGSFTYTPDAGITGTDLFSYKASDGTALSTKQTVVLTISTNQPPVATADAYSVAEDESLTVGAPGVLANDSDPEGSPLSAALVAGATHGTLTLSSDGSFTYTPGADFAGSDQFSYDVSDGTSTTGPVTVALTVDPVADPPVAADDAWGVGGSTLSVPAPGVLGNDIDVDGDPLTSTVGLEPAHGALVLAADGSFSYTAEPGFTGTDSFTYVASDGASSASATVTLTVDAGNQPPSGTPDSYLVSEDSSLAVDAGAGVLANDTDADGDPLTASLALPTTHGGLTLEPDGAFTYTPDPDFFGIDTFTYSLSDGNVSELVAVTLTIDPTPDPPVASDDTYTMDEDDLLVVPAPGVLADDTDADGDALSVMLLTEPQHGALALAPDGAFTYAPDPDFHGVDSFVYSVTDGTASATAAVSLQILPVPDAPVAQPETYDVDGDGIFTVEAPGVLVNDSDADDDPLIAILQEAATAGTLVLDPDGSFRYTPPGEPIEIDQFTYLVSDGSMESQPVTVSLRFPAGNAPPDAADDSYSVNEDKVLNVAAGSGLLLNDADPEGEPLTVSLAGDVSHGTLFLGGDGSFSYIPDPDFAGDDSFSYTVSDGINSSDPANVAIEVAAVNDTPTGLDDFYSVAEDGVLSVAAPGILANDVDVDGDPLTVSLDSDVTQGALTLNADGSFEYVPAPDFQGSDQFVYTIFDGTASSPRVRVYLTVEAGNDPPVASADAYSVDEDKTLTVNLASSVLANDDDPDGDVLTAVLVDGTDHGTLALAADGTFTYTPAANYFGTDSFTYQASDGVALSPSATVSLTITAKDDRTTVANDTYSVLENNVLTVAAPGVLANDKDVDGDPLTVKLSQNVSRGTLVLSPDGSFTYTPQTDFVGTVKFKYVVFDGVSNSKAASVSLVVTDGANPPVAAADAYSNDEDKTIVRNVAQGVLANDTDADGDPLTAVLLTGTSFGELSLAADGSLTYTPQPDWNGVDTFTYAASDGSAQSAPATVTITVRAVNDPPKTVEDLWTIAEGEALDVAAPGVLANDSDVDDTTLTASLAVAPLNGMLTLNADGSLSYTPDAGFSGQDSFQYLACDLSNACAQGTARITVESVNAPPVALPDSYHTAPGVNLSVAAGEGVLANDSDPDGDALTASLVAAPSHGALTGPASDGRFTYKPENGFVGVDSFTYLASDGEAGSEVTTVTLTVD